MKAISRKLVILLLIQVGVIYNLDAQFIFPHECGSPLPSNPNPNFSINCGSTSPAFLNRYQQLATWQPYASDNVKTIKISFNIINDANGNGSFTSNTIDPDYANQRNYLTNTLPGWLNMVYSINGSISTLWAGETVINSDPIPNVIDIADTKIRFDLGAPGSERIYYYNNGTLWSDPDLASGGDNLFNMIVADNSRNDQYNTLNIFLSEASYLGVGGYVNGYPQYGVFTGNLRIVSLGSFGIYNRFPLPPDFQTARTLIHELGHILNLKHTYDSGAPCSGGVDYLDDVFGTPPPGNCPHLSVGCPYAYDFPADLCTNNIMSSDLDPCYFSPKQIGNCHRSLALKTTRIYLKECVYNTLPLSVTNSEVWDFDFQNDRDVIIDNNSTLEITCKLSMPNGSKIIVNPGSTLIIDGVVTNNCDGAWDGLIDVKENATLHLKGDAEVHLKGNGKIFIEGNTSGDATMIYDAGGDIFLENINTHIEIQGNLQLTDNANFTFNYSGNAHGYVKFSSTHPLPLNVQAGINCSMSFVGSNQILKVLEVDQEGLYPPSNLVNFTVQDGTIRLHSGDRVLPLGWSTFVTLSNARVTGHLSGVNNNHLGFQMVGQSHLLSNTIFEYGDYGLHYVGTLGRNDLQAWNCTFRNCMEGLYTDDKGVELHSCYFSSNETGWNTGSMSNPSMADQGTVGGSIASANIKGYFYNSLN